MNDWEAIKPLSNLALVSEYFLQITLDKTGKVIKAGSKLGTTTPSFDPHENPSYFKDYFLASNWAHYDSQRIKAKSNLHRSFLVYLDKIIYSESRTIATKWEFFFISEDFDICLGIGHPVLESKVSDPSLGDLFDSSISGNKELFDSLLEDKLLGFWEFDLQSKTDYISQGLGQMLGYSQKELENSNAISWQQHVHPEDYSSLVKDLTNHFQIKGSVPFKKEFRINSKTGQTIWVLGFGKTIQWSGIGHPIKVLGCLVDISERKKQEISLKEHHEFLQELAFEQSHSLRARVANILGILEIMDAEPQNSEAKRLVQMIKNEAKILDQSLMKSIKESVSQNKAIEGAIPQETSFPNK